MAAASLKKMIAPHSNSGYTYVGSLAFRQIDNEQSPVIIERLMDISLYEELKGPNSAPYYAIMGYPMIETLGISVNRNNSVLGTNPLFDL